MSFIRAIALGVAGTVLACAAANTFGQIVINELVEDEQDFETTDVTDTREFVELDRKSVV